MGESCNVLLLWLKIQMIIERTNVERLRFMKAIILNLGFILLSALTASAQTGSISGTVTTSDGKPAEYVSVTLKGTSKGDVTDGSGNYLVKAVKPGTYVILTSHVGASTQEQQVEVKQGETVVVNFILNENLTELTEVIIVDSKLNKYYRDSSLVVAKLPLKDIENPQVYNTISKEVLADQVVTNFNDALKNATGVARLWESTGRGGDGAEYYSMRGFSVQPSMVNGLPSINNGALDPANVETIDVIKGPSGTLFGSPAISYGGLINITTKRPYDKVGGQFNYVTGSNALNRFVADVNVPLNNQVFARINMAYHTENSFQDAGFKKSFFIAPSLKFVATDKLTFLLNAEFLNAESANAPMIFLNRYGALSFDNLELFEKHYDRSFTSNDLAIKNPTSGVQAQALYKLSSRWTSQTVLSRSSSKNNGYYHYLWDFGDGNTFGRYISRRNGETVTTDFQQNFIGEFDLGAIHNKLLIGFDYFKSNVYNGSAGWVLNGVVTVQDGEDTGILTQPGVDNLLINSSEGVSNAENRVVSAYVADVLNITANLSVMAAVRFDQFNGKTAYWATDDAKDQSSVSPKFGVVYQALKDKVSIFGNYMNGFVNVAPTEVAEVDGSNPRMKTFDPEHANQYEFGVKTNLINGKLSATASYYNILVENRVMTDPTNINNSIQGGEVESKGFELSLIANPMSGLNIIAGYSDNTSEVTKDNPDDGYLGMRPEEAGPAKLGNLWISYTIKQGALNGFGLGFGGNYASEHKTLNRSTTGTFTLPSYTILNASVSYTANQYAIILKMNNITDEKYYSGWSTITPQNVRNVSLSLNYKF